MKADSNYIKILYSEENTLGETPSSPAMTEIGINGETLNFAPKYTTSQEIRSDRQTADLTLTGADIGGELKFELNYETYDKFFEHALFNSFSAPINISGTDIEAVADNGLGYSEFVSTSTDFSGISVDQWIKVEGFSNAANNGFFQVAAVSSDTITLFGIKLVDESAGNSITIKNDGTLQNGTTKKSFLIEKQYTDINKFQHFKGVCVDSFSLDFAVEKIIEGKVKLLAMEASEMVDSSVAGSVIPTIV